MFSHAIRHINDSGTGGKPYDAEVEYLAGNDARTAYIQTSIVPTSTMLVEAEVSYVSGAQNGWWFNTEAQYYNTTSTSTTGNAFGFGWTVAEPSRITYGGGFTRGPSNVFIAGTKMKLVFQGGIATLDGTTWANRSASTLTQTTWLAILGNHRGTSDSVIECADSKYRLHSLKIQDGGIVLANFVPVRVGTEYCLYDKANPTGGDNGDGLYHNKGTGAFLGGVDKPKFIVSRVMGNSLGKVKPVLKHYDMAMSYTIDECNGNAPSAVNVNFPSDKYSALNYTPTWAHHRFVGWYTTNAPAFESIEDELPAGAKLLQYTESSGSQYIATTVQPHKDLIIRSEFTILDTVGGGVIRSRPDNDSNDLRVFENRETTWNKIFQDRGSGRIMTPLFSSHHYVIEAGNFYLKNLNDNSTMVSGSTVSPTFPSNYYMNVFWNTSREKARVNWCQFLLNGNITCDLYAVKNSSGVAGMFDRVTGQILYSSTSTSLIAGPELDFGTKIVSNDSVVFDYSTIYARWQLPTTVTFDASSNGGNMPQGWAPPDYYEGQQFGTLPTPTHSTLNFAGWYDRNGNKVETNTVVSISNMSLIAQYLAQSYTVDISNGDWELEDPNTNPDTTAYDGVYRNLRYWNSPPGTYVDKLYIDVIGYTSFTVYIRSHAEVNYSYTVAVKADHDPTSFTDAINNKQGATTTNNSSTGISAYTAVTYTLDGGSHRICIAYGHKDSIKQNSDRGYLLIPKQQ